MARITCAWVLGLGALTAVAACGDRGTRASVADASARVAIAAATISAICLFFVDWILHFMPWFEDYHPWMMTTHMSTWLNCFRPHIPWETMIEDYGYLFGLNGTFLIIGALVFCARDFKS